MSAAAWLFLRRFWPFLLVGIVLSAIIVGAVFWVHQDRAQVRRETQLIARDTVIQWRTDTAAARSRERRVDSGSVTQSLAERRRDTLWRHDTVHVAGDTTTRIAIPLGTLTKDDTAFARCERLNHSCSAEHIADSLVIVGLRQSLALARTGSVTTCAAPRNWHLGISGGYGGTLAKDSTGKMRVYSGPSVLVGGAFTFF